MSNLPIPSTSIDGLLDARDKIVLAMTSFRAILADLDARLEPFGVERPGILFQFEGDVSRDLLRDVEERELERQRREIDRHFWVRLFELTSVDTLMTASWSKRPTGTDPIFSHDSPPASRPERRKGLYEEHQTHRHPRGPRRLGLRRLRSRLCRNRRRPVSRYTDELIDWMAKRTQTGVRVIQEALINMLASIAKGRGQRIAKLEERLRDAEAMPRDASAFASVKGDETRCRGYGVAAHSCGTLADDGDDGIDFPLSGDDQWPLASVRPRSSWSRAPAASLSSGTAT